MQNYSASTLAQYLGKPESRVEAILNVLATTEEGILDEGDTVGLSVYQAEAAARQAKRVLKETDDPKLAKGIGKRCEVRPTGGQIAGSRSRTGSI